MSVTKVRLSRETKGRLGQQGINEMCRHLYAVDCQTCGRGLGPKPPAVTVDDHGDFVQAMLHHEKCTAPRWRVRNAIVVDHSAVPMLTYRVHHVMAEVPLFPADGPFTPIVILNPGLEAINLRLDDHGHWRVDTVDFYTSFDGVQRASRSMPMTEITGGAIVLNPPQPDGMSSGRVYLGPLRRWASAVPRYVAEAVEHYRGAILLITTAVDPHAIDHFDQDDLTGLIDSGDCAFGWLPLMPIGPRRPR